MTPLGHILCLVMVSALAVTMSHAACDGIKARGCATSFETLAAKTGSSTSMACPALAAYKQCLVHDGCMIGPFKLAFERAENDLTSSCSSASTICCMMMSKECLACKKGVSVAEFCKDLANMEYCGGLPVIARSTPTPVDEPTSCSECVRLGRSWQVGSCQPVACRGSTVTAGGMPWGQWC